MREQDNEAQVVSAIDAIQKSEKLSRRDAAKLYDVPETTMCDRISVATPMAESRPAIQVLTAFH